MQQVPLQPVFGQGRQFRGFAVVSVFGNRPKALRYGVYPGDMVLRVNGQALLTPAHLMQVFRLLRNATRLEIVVSRRGKKVEVKVPIIDPGVS